MSLEAHHRLHENIENKDRFELIHSKKSVKIIDRWVMVVGILAPFTALPQIYRILVLKNAQEVSFSTWALFIIMSLFWLVYGIAHEEKPIIINNSLWIIMDIFILLLILVYR